MKKILVFLLVLFVCLSTTGCGDKDSMSGDSKSGTLVCSKEEIDEDGYKTTDTIEVTYKDEKVSLVKNTIISEMDEDVLSMSYSLSELFASALNEIDGYTITVSKESDTTLKTETEVDYNKLDLDELKSALGDAFDEDDTSFYSSKDVNIEDFKNDNLKDYTCK